jgi:putative restriction endonuclease
LRAGEPFLFKMHSPRSFIAGGGFFVRYSALPLSIAWEAFGDKNGAPDLDTCHRRIAHYRRDRPEPDPIIGCVVLAQPFFFNEEDWVPAPSDWSPNIVRGKTYGEGDGIGQAVWAQVQERLARHWQPAERPLMPAGQVAEPPNAAPRYGQPHLTRPRLGQGAFRVLVTEAYGRRCAVTGEKTLPVLTAAHIKPYHRSGPHDVRNGLLLRSDLHLLFDRGLLTVTKDHHVQVSHRIRDQYGNGREYYAMHGRELAVVPARQAEGPAPEYLEWHNQNLFVP